MKYSVITFGCRVNQADSLAFEEELLGAGAQPGAVETADVVVVNTCSVTASADQGARQTIRRIARSNPNARIVVTGCYATRRPADLQGLPNVVSIVPNDRKHLLSHGIVMSDFASSGIRLQPDLSTAETFSDVGMREIRLQPDVSTAETFRDVGMRGIRLQPDLSTAERFSDGGGSCGATIEPGVAGRTAFTLRVQTGCGEPCSYCIIPTTRGEPRSLPIDAVLREVDRVTRAGFKEIALTGVHLGSYGRDLTPPTCLTALLQALASHVGGAEGQRDDRCTGDAVQVVGPPVLFRISSLEPMDCTAEIVRLVAEQDCFAPHFHLPLQHASNRVLRAMRRPYGIEQYATLVANIRGSISHASIGSDVIVGFPGETDADFELLAEYLEHSPLSHVHVFPYSDRPGTPASTMDDKVPGAIVRARCRRVRDIASELTRRFRLGQIGTTHRALTLEDGALVVTGNYLKLRIPPGHRRNEWVRVRVASDHHGELLGR